MVREPVTTTVSRIWAPSDFGASGAWPVVTWADTVEARANMLAPILIFLIRISSPDYYILNFKAVNNSDPTLNIPPYPAVIPARNTEFGD
jgi:hypothetical protein